MTRRIRSVLFVSCALAIAAAMPVVAMERLDVEEQLRIIASGEDPERRISGAEFRIGAFTYEDPDGTGLGDALASLVGHEMLLDTQVRSLGILVFEGSLAPGPGERLSYYDKVDRVTAAQGVSIATWGVVRRIDDDLVIDTYVQIPPESLETHFSWQRALPAAMGGGTVRSRLQPDRIRAQRLRVPAAAADRFVAAAAMLVELRESPTRAARITGTVPRGEVYYVRERAGDWVRLQTRTENGWVPLRGHCTGPCEPVLEAASFVGALVRFMADHEDPSSPSGTATPLAGMATSALSADALAVSEQLQAIAGLRHFGELEIRDTLALASRWSGPDRWSGVDERTRIERGNGVPPGGAAFANLRAIAKIGAELADAHRRTGAAYDDLELPRDSILAIADELAEAALDDPRNIDVLENLAVLFRACGDEQRADLARGIVRQSVPRD